MVYNPLKLSMSLIVIQILDNLVRREIFFLQALQKLQFEMLLVWSFFLPFYVRVLHEMINGGKASCCIQFVRYV